MEKQEFQQTRGEVTKEQETTMETSEIEVGGSNVPTDTGIEVRGDMSPVVAEALEVH